MDREWQDQIPRRGSQPVVESPAASDGNRTSRADDKQKLASDADIQVTDLVEQLHHDKDVENKGVVQRRAICQAGIGHAKHCIRMEHRSIHHHQLESALPRYRLQDLHSMHRHRHSGLDDAKASSTSSQIDNGRSGRRSSVPGDLGKFSVLCIHVSDRM